MQNHAFTAIRLSTPLVTLPGILFGKRVSLKTGLRQQAQIALAGSTWASPASEGVNRRSDVGFYHLSFKAARSCWSRASRRVGRT